MDRMNYVDYTSSSCSSSGDLSNYYTKGQTNTLISNNSSITLSKSQLELCFNQAYNSAYHEPIEVNGLITQINIYDTPAKGTLLFSKIFNRVDGVLSSIVVTDEINDTSLTKTFTFIDGKWKSTSKTYGNYRDWET